MATVTLAKALKMKNRLKGEIDRLSGDVERYARQPKDRDPNLRVDAAELWEERSDLVDRLIMLKTAIAKANGPILWDIFTVSELKAEIALLRSLDPASLEQSYGRGYAGVSLCVHQELFRGGNRCPASRPRLYFG